MKTTRGPCPQTCVAPLHPWCQRKPRCALKALKGLHRGSGLHRLYGTQPLHVVLPPVPCPQALKEVHLQAAPLLPPPSPPHAPDSSLPNGDGSSGRYRGPGPTGSGANGSNSLAGAYGTYPYGARQGDGTEAGGVASAASRREEWSAFAAEPDTDYEVSLYAPGRQLQQQQGELQGESGASAVPGGAGGDGAGSGGGGRAGGEPGGMVEFELRPLGLTHLGSVGAMRDAMGPGAGRQPPALQREATSGSGSSSITSSPAQSPPPSPPQRTSPPHLPLHAHGRTPRRPQPVLASICDDEHLNEEERQGQDQQLQVQVQHGAMPGAATAGTLPRSTAASPSSGSPPPAAATEDVPAPRGVASAPSRKTVDRRTVELAAPVVPPPPSPGRSRTATPVATSAALPSPFSEAALAGKLQLGGGVGPPPLALPPRSRLGAAASASSAAAGGTASSVARGPVAGGGGGIVEAQRTPSTPFASLLGRLAGAGSGQLPYDFFGVLGGGGAGAGSLSAAPSGSVPLPPFAREPERPLSLKVGGRRWVHGGRQHVLPRAVLDVMAMCCWSVCDLKVCGCRCSILSQRLRYRKRYCTWL